MVETHASEAKIHAVSVAPRLEHWSASIGQSYLDEERLIVMEIEDLSEAQCSWAKQCSLCWSSALVRVRNPKNQLSQINSPTTVGCSLEYPIAKSPWNWRRNCCLCRTMCFYYRWDAKFIFLNFVLYTKDRMKLAT